MQENPKRHHFVPECYLSQFTDSAGFFWVKDIKYNKVSKKHPSGVCYEINGNKIRKESSLEWYNIADEYLIEKEAFKIQENNYAKFATEISRYKSSVNNIDKKEYKLFLETLVTIKRRNPKSRLTIIEAFKASYKSEKGYNEFIETYKAVLGIKELPVEMPKIIKSFLENETTDEDRLYDLYLSAYINKTEYTNIHQVTEDLYKLDSIILHPPIGRKFLTTDNPGFSKYGSHIISLGGFGGDFEFYFPITPTACLYLDSKKITSIDSLNKAISHVLIDSSYVSQINRWSISICNAKVFAITKNML